MRVPAISSNWWTMANFNVLWFNFQSRMVANIDQNVLQIIFWYIIWNTSWFNIITLYCSYLAWFFSRLMICSSSFVFTFLATASSLLIFLFVECSWVIVSFSFGIWLQMLDISESMITFPFNTIIFCTSPGFFMAFIADSEKVNKLLLSPVLTD